jgi:hypothetical protein
MDTPASSSTPSSTWHIIWQAVDGRDLLADEDVLERIRQRLLDAHKLPGRALVHYLITPRELHLVSRLPSWTSPGDIAREISSIVARWIHQSLGKPGIVFAGPYRAYAVESHDNMRSEIRMLAWRPFLLGLCEHPIHYTMSSLRALLGRSRARGFDIHPLLDLFATAVKEARVELHDCIGERPDAAEIRQWELVHGIVMAPGMAGISSPVSRSVSGLAAAMVAGSQPQAIDGALRLLERWVLVKIGRPDVPELSSLSSQAGARGRALVAILATRLDLCSAASVARHFKRAKATLSERMDACLRHAEDQAILNVALERVVREALDLPAIPPAGHP